MNPYDDQTRDMPNAPDREHTLNTQRQAAVNVIRGDIDRIFNNGGSPTAEVEESIKQEYAKELAKESLEDTKLEADSANPNMVQDDIDGHWKQYHSSWQSYYKQYYERYYLNHVHDFLNYSIVELVILSMELQDMGICQIYS
jgi:hypothetical protein